MSLILEASRSIFARDGGALLKPVTTRQRRQGLELKGLELTKELTSMVVC